MLNYATRALWSAHGTLLPRCLPPGTAQDCPKCVFLVDESGKKLVLKNGRKILKSFDLSEDKVLSAAIKTR